MKNPLRKPRADSVLNNLPVAHQQRIVDWLSNNTYLAVIEKIAAAPPEGLGLRVQYTSLRRFWQRHITSELSRQRSEAASSLDRLARNNTSSPSPYPALTLEALERYCFNLALNPNANADQILKMNTLLIRLRDQEIRTQKWACSLEDRDEALAAEEENQAAAEASTQSVRNLLVKLFNASTPPKDKEQTQASDVMPAL